jgi:hypothetical protein
MDTDYLLQPDYALAPVEGMYCRASVTHALGYRVSRDNEA